MKRLSFLPFFRYTNIRQFFLFELKRFKTLLFYHRMEKVPMKNRKFQKIYFIFSIFYLSFFIICCYFTFINRTISSSITLPKNVKYTNYDCYHKNDYLGSYYYAFTQNGLQLYFLHAKPPISTSKKYEGYFEPLSNNTKLMTEKLAKKVGFSLKDMNQLTIKTVFFEKEPLSSFHILFLSISAIFAFYSLIECILFLKQSFHILEN